MDKKRISFHNKLVSLFPGVHVYYQAPSNVKMTYPCIIYELDGEHSFHADNMKYSKKNRYSIKIMDRDPDSELVEKISSIPGSLFKIRFVKDGLYHTVYTLYF